MTRKSYILAAAAVLVGQLASAQNFNPKVEVTNTYESKGSDARKQDVPMSVPDSLTTFEYTLDYSVFENPYRGSYDFKPYMIEMRPDPKPSDASTLYLRAGAGYTLHPELDFVYSPVLSAGKTHLSIYDTFRGYIGAFGRNVDDFGADVSAGQYIWGKMDKFGKGHVFDNNFGINAERSVGKFILGGDASYHLLASKDSLGSHMFHQGILKAYFRPAVPETSGWFYGGELSVSTGADKADFLMDDRLWQTGVDAVVSVGFPVGTKGKIAGDVNFQSVFNRGAFDADAYLVSAAPHYVITTDRTSLWAGLKLSILGGGSLDDKTYNHRGQYIYPDVHASYFLIPGYMKAYVDVSGGDKVNSYASLLELNPYLHTTSATAAQPMLDFSSEKVNFEFGFKGNVASKLEYKACVGYVIYSNGLLDVATTDEAYYNWMSSSYYTYNEFSPCFYGTYGYFDYDLFRADIDLLWKSRRFDMEAGFRVNQTRFDDAEAYAVAAAPYQGRFAATYNWNRRVFAGLSLQYQSARDGHGSYLGTYGPVNVPGFIDLGVNAMYKVDSRWSVWARGGNLLNDAVQQYFLHCEKGISFTLGICWNIR